MHNLRT